jgi:hypothetical protein
MTTMREAIIVEVRSYDVNKAYESSSYNCLLFLVCLSS